MSSRCKWLVVVCLCTFLSLRLSFIAFPSLNSSQEHVMINTLNLILLPSQNVTTISNNNNEDRYNGAIYTPVVDTVTVQSRSLSTADQGSRREARHFDIIVPQQGKHERVKSLAVQIAKSWIAYQQNASADYDLTLRLLISWNSVDQNMFANSRDEELYKSSVKESLLSTSSSSTLDGSISTISVDFVFYNNIGSSDQTSNNTSKPLFSRSLTLNTLQNAACHSKHCYVASVDVDMIVRPVFFANILKNVHTGKTVYFPVVWSQYGPDSVKTLERFTRRTFGDYSKHVGFWRSTGHGMCVLSGPDALIFQYNTSFVGWGGEDSDFYDRIKIRRQVRRHLEPGLIHVWHPKECILGETVGDKLYNRCNYVKNKLDASIFAHQFKAIRVESPLLFKAIVTRPSKTGDTLPVPTYLFSPCNVRSCMNEVIDEYEEWPIYECPFGEKFYKIYYPYVNQSIARGEYKSGFEHFKKVGYEAGNEYLCNYSLKDRLKECCQRQLSKT